MGYPAAGLARCLDVPPRQVWDIIRGVTATVKPEVHCAVSDLYERMWDRQPPARVKPRRTQGGESGQDPSEEKWVAGTNGPG